MLTISQVVDHVKEAMEGFGYENVTIRSTPTAYERDPSELIIISSLNPATEMPSMSLNMVTGYTFSLTKVANLGDTLPIGEVVTTFAGDEAEINNFFARLKFIDSESVFITYAVSDIDNDGLRLANQYVKSWVVTVRNYE